MDVDEVNKIIKEIRQRENSSQEEEVSGLFYVNRNLVIQWIDRYAANVAGAGPDEMIGEYCYSTWFNREEPCQECPLQETLENGSTKEFIKTGPNGKSWKLRSRPVYNDENVIEYVIGFVEEMEECRPVGVKLRQTVEEYKQLVESSPTIICQLDRDGTVLFVNKWVWDLTGYSLDELVGENWWDTFYPGELESEVKELYKEFGKGDVRDYDMTLISREGEKRIISWSSFNDWDPQTGDLLRINGVGVDITERKKTEQKLKESKQKFQSVVESTPEAIINIDQDRNIVYWNDGAEIIFGYEKEEAEKKKIQDLFPEESWESFEELIDDVFENNILKSEIPIEVPALRKDGSEVPVEWTYTAWWSNDDLIFTAIGREITEIRMAEEEIRELSQLRKTIIDNANVWLDVVDEKGNVVIWNKAAEEISGYKRKEVVGHNKIWEWLYPDDDYRKKITKTTREIIEEGKDVEEFETTIVTKDGQEKIISWYSRNLLNKNGEIINSIALGRDVTSHRRIERQLKDYKDRLEAVMAKGDLAWWEMDVKTGEVNFNRKKSAMLGYPANKFEDYTDFTDLLHPDDYEAAMNEMKNHLEGNTERYDIEYRIKTSSGDYKWFRDIGTITEWDSNEDPLKVTGIVVDITEGKKKEFEIQEKEERYRLLAETAEDLILIHDLDGYITYVNEAAAEYGGYTKKELIGQHIEKFIAPDELEQLEERQKRRLDGEANNYFFQTCFQNRWGEEIDVEVSSAPILREGKPVKILVVARDITERLKAERELLEKSNALKQSINGIAITDLEGIVKYVNPALVDMWGFPSQESMLGRDYLEFFHDKKRAVKAIKEVRETGGWSGEITGKKQDGSTFPLRLSANIIRDEDDKPTGILGSMVDITEERKVKRELEKSRDHYKAVFENTGAATCIIEEDTTISLVNSKFAKLAGYPPEEIEGKMSWTYFVKEDDLQRMKEYHKKRRQEPGSVPWSYEFKFVDRSGNTHSVFMNVAMIPHTSKSVASVMDITDRKEAQEKKDEYRTLLESAFEGVDSFLMLIDRNHRIILSNWHDHDWVPEEKRDQQPFCYKVLKGYDSPCDYCPPVKTFEDGKPRHYEDQNPVDGSYKDITVTPIFGENGEVEYVLESVRDITAEKKAEEELRRRSKAMESSMEGMAILNPEGKFVFMNQVHADVYEYDSPEDLLGKSWRNLYEDGEIKRFEEDVIPRLEKDGYWRGQAKGVTKHGRKFSQELSLSLMDDGYLVCIVRDISLRKAMEEQLQKSKDEYQAMVEEINSVIFQINSKGIITYMSPVVERLNGYSQSEVRGEKFDKIIVEDDLPGVNENFEKVLKGEATSHEFRIKTKEEDVKWVRASAKRIIEEGEIKGLRGVMIDITDEKQARQKYETIVSNINDALYVHDFEGNLIDVNEIVCERLGYSREELIGAHLSKIDSKKTAEQLENSIHKLIEKDSMVFEAEHVKKDGTVFPVSISSKVVTREGDGIIQSLARDITEQKKAEERLRKANAKLKQLDELKTQFLNMTSHELRTPLTPMIAQLEMTMEDIDRLDEDQIRGLQMVLRNAKRLNFLIEDILDISRLESGSMDYEMRKTNLGNVIQDAVETMKLKSDRNSVELNFEKKASPEMVFDPYRITQVITNLINNSIKYAPEVTKIKVTLEKESNRAIISVLDDGPGIKKEDQERIFRPFEQGDKSVTRERGGSGLGLAISRGIVKQHGGEIWVESEPGEYTKFVLTLPMGEKKTGIVELFKKFKNEE